MTKSRGRMVVLGALSLYVFVLGFAGGMLSERIRFDRDRAGVLQRYDAAVRQWQGFLMRTELQAAARPADVDPAQEER